MIPEITASLKDEVESMLRHDSHLKDCDIEVLDRQGVIVLQGEVPHEENSMIAEGLTREVDGVLDVSNRLYIRSVMFQFDTPLR